MAIRVGILTVSDRSARGERADLSGPALVQTAALQGWVVARTAIVADEADLIAQTLRDWCDAGALDVALTTGGTGFAPRDVTPEATRAIIERDTPGLAEMMRLESYRITPHAMLSRGVAGIRGRTLVINLPGSPKAAVENLGVIAAVIPHAVDLLREAPHAEAGHMAGHKPQ